MLVVTNSSPLINLSGIGCLHLLDQWNTIIVPDAVYHEVVVRGAGQPGAVEVATAPRFVRRSVQQQTAVTTLLRQYANLSRAEVEAIVLTQELHAHLVLIDEDQARTLAQHLGLPVRGILGILLEAKAAGRISLVKPLMDALRQFGFKIDKRTYNVVLQAAGE